MPPTHTSSNLYFFFDPVRNVEYLIDTEEKSLKKNGKDTKITKSPWKILLLLVENEGKLVRDERFIREIWEGRYFQRNLKNTLAVQINRLRKILDDEDKTIIETKSGAGYKFNLRVEKRDKLPFVVPAPKNEIPDTPQPPEIEIDDMEAKAAYRLPAAIFGLIVAGIFIYLASVLGECRSGCSEKAIFTLFAVLFYGILSGIGLLLECAYQFDKYGWPAAKMVPSIVFVNAGAMAIALAMPGYFSAQEGFPAFWAGLAFLAAGAVIACFMAYFVLPNESIVKAKFQTQPAFAAFYKNMGLYFLPLYAVFIVLVFNLVYSVSVPAANIYLLAAFSALWIVIFFFSLLSTNYLSDNLVKSDENKIYRYHGLYSSLLILRGILCFMPTAAGIVWYFSHSIGANSFR